MLSSQAHPAFPPSFNSPHAEVNDEPLVLIMFIHLLKYFKKQNFINFEDWRSIWGWGGGIGTLCGPFVSALFCYPITTPASSPNQPLALLLICRGLWGKKRQYRKQHGLQFSRQIDKCSSTNHMASQSPLQDGMMLMGLVALVLVSISDETKIILLVSWGKIMLTPTVSSDQPLT